MWVLYLIVYSNVFFLFVGLLIILRESLIVRPHLSAQQPPLSSPAAAAMIELRIDWVELAELTRAERLGGGRGKGHFIIGSIN